MSWEQEDSLRRKVREACERRAFKESIDSVLSAKEAQAAPLGSVNAVLRMVLPHFPRPALPRQIVQ
jgi:hypothetical protein